MRYMTFFLCSLILFILSGCGAGFDSGGAGTGVGGGDSEIPYTPEQQAFLDSAKGSWHSNCILVSGDAVIQSFKQSMHITQSGIAVNYMLFSDGTCSIQTGLVTKSLSTLRIGSTGPGGYGYEYSSYGTAGSIYPMSSPVATNLNARSVCGHTSWASGGSLTWAGKSCEIPTGSILMAAEQSYGIIDVDTTVSPNVMILGDRATGTGVSTATRPTAYDPVIYFEKQ